MPIYLKIFKDPKKVRLFHPEINKILGIQQMFNIIDKLMNELRLQKSILFLHDIIQLPSYIYYRILTEFTYYNAKPYKLLN